MNTKEMVEKLVSWIKDTVLAAGCKGAVIGMSGGIDSSVLAVLCQRALPQSTLGIFIPCYNSQTEVEHAQAVATQFSIPTRIVRLDSVFDALLKVLPDDKADPAINRITKGNLKARLRMLTLYYFANQLNYMVVGSSNRSELSIGYFTKYGDGGVDIVPLGNLVKEQIRELACFLDIPQQIIDKPPSADLWEGQTDEDELGLSYEELDRYLITGEADKELREKIESMIANNYHKRQPPPVARF